MNREQIAEGARLILKGLGEDVVREGLKDTPDRVARAWLELCSGYEMSAEKVLESASFEGNGYDEMITVGPVDFYSTCEHHLLPFIGEAWVAYVPREKVVGLSKLPRLVEVYARRLQIQERMTQEIATAIEKHLNPKGWAVLIRAKHLCTCARGVAKPRVLMTTTSLGGVFRENPSAKAEFLAEIRSRE